MTLLNSKGTTMMRKTAFATTVVGAFAITFTPSGAASANDLQRQMQLDRIEQQLNQQRNFGFRERRGRGLLGALWDPAEREKDREFLAEEMEKQRAHCIEMAKRGFQC